MSQDNFWFHFEEMFKEFPSFFNKAKKNNQVTIIVTEINDKRTFHVSGSISKKMINLIRRELNNIEEKINGTSRTSVK